MTGKLGRVARLAVQARAVLLAFFSCLAPAAALHAQEPAGSGQAAAVAQYVVQAGDVLSVLIWGWPTPVDRLEGQFPVESSGKAYLPLVGEVDVAGKTTERVRSEVRQRVLAEQRQAVIVIEPLFAVGVNGAVTQPGVLEFRPGQTVFDAISRAGGYTTDADRTQVLLVRDGRAQTLSAPDASALAELLAQTPLRSGDRLLVHPRRRLASGAVLNVLQAVIAAVTLYTLITK